MIRRFALLLAAATLLAVVLDSSSALAAAPKKGAKYSAVIVERGGPREYRLPISFVVSRDGRSAASFSMPDGIPASTRCAAGPLGTPVSHAVQITRGRFDETFKLGHPGGSHLGTARVWGSFGAHGTFTGRFTNGSNIRPCDATFRFVARTG